MSRGINTLSCVKGALKTNQGDVSVENFEVIVEHDFFSRKPINITFQCKLIEKVSGTVLHSVTFKHRNFDYGLYKARQFRRTFSQDKVIFGLILADVSQKAEFKPDMSRGFDQFMKDLFHNSSSEYLREYLARTSHEEDRNEIKKELHSRGESL